MLRQINANTVLDIGANRGQFALAVHKLLPSARIISFEPIPKAAEIFREVFRGTDSVTLHETAVGPRSGDADIHVSNREDSSSLLPIAEAQDAIFPGTAEIGTQRVRVARLTDCVSKESLKPSDLLKIDVQGFELEVLNGCDEYLALLGWIYVECSFIELYEGQALADEVIDWLRDRGFTLQGVYNMTYDKRGRAVQADFLFQRTGNAGDD